MQQNIAKVWTFASDSNPEKTYETLMYEDGTTSCNCKGWTVKRHATRTCKHTRLVDQGVADQYSLSSNTYSQVEVQRIPVKVAAKRIKAAAPVRAGRRFNFEE